MKNVAPKFKEESLLIHLQKLVEKLSTQLTLTFMAMPTSWTMSVQLSWNRSF